MKFIFNKYVILIWLLLSIALCFVIYTNTYSIHRGCDLVSENDEWEHQSMAVNYAKGFGAYKLGAFAPVSEYHIDACDATLPFLRKLFTKYPTEYYHRAAGFSIITGTLYQLTGTEPYYLRLFNFVLIILSWIITCFAFIRHKKYFNLLLLALPVYICFNFFYIDQIGDEPLLIFSLSIVFFALINWVRKPNLLFTFFLLLSLSFSVFIKTTLLFMPVFTLLIVIGLRLKKQIAGALFMNAILFAAVIIISGKINKKHQSYAYPNQQQFHTDMIKSDWSKEDSTFIKTYHLTYRDNVNFSIDLYKQLAAYLFERQFFTKKSFLLSGQSLFLLIDGNNETCIHVPAKNIGSWMPLWKLTKTSYFYTYTEDQSPYAAIAKFYLKKPYFFPLIVYCKLYAGYYWNYLFLLISALQLSLCILLLQRKNRLLKTVLIIGFSIILHILLRQLFLTPILVIGFLITSMLILIRFKNRLDRSVSIIYIPYLITFYFLFLTVLMFGLNRYTCIANSMSLLIIVFLLSQMSFLLKKNHETLS